MQIVIDIPDDFYKKVQDNYRLGNGDAVQIPIGCIANGTPLPKGHGRLIDADVLVDGMEDDYEFCEAVNATPTIIEAERSEE